MYKIDDSKRYTIFLINNSTEIPAKEVINELTGTLPYNKTGVTGVDVDFICSKKNSPLSKFGIEDYSDIVVVFNFKKIS